MTASGATGGRSRNLILAAMIFAVAMTFIDQTIVSIAAPQIQSELGLTSTGVQWAINAYLLSLAALFAFGGRLADTVGHRKMVTLGVVVFAAASAMCGLTPKGSFAEAWIVTFRVIQGAGGAIMFPAALAIVVQTFALRERGKALAIFFGIAGGLTAIGPVLGGYLTQWTWRAIFWVNIPIAIIALVLIVVSKPVTDHKPARMDYRGLALIASGVALSVFGFQQSTIWGWSNPGTAACVAVGAALLVVFYFVQERTSSPLIQVSIFRIRPFLVENIVLGVSMLVFVPVFFFASEYAQIALGESASQAGLFLLFFFIGFVVAAQIGGRMLDRAGAKRPVVLGCALAAVGFSLWAGKVTGLSFATQRWYIIVAGAGVGFMLGPASTDAVNRASRLTYGEATGITQTVRNYAASLGLAILGTILVTQTRSRITTSLISLGVPSGRASAEASRISQSRRGSVASIPHFVRLDFAYATQTVLYVMAGIMAVAAVIALLGLRRGAQEDTAAPETDSVGRQSQGESPGSGGALMTRPKYRRVITRTSRRELAMPYVTVGTENSGAIEIYYEDHGSGQPVVLIHGYPLSGRAWDKQVPVLLDAGHRVITYDRRGFGKSSQPTSGYDYDTLASDLHALMEHLDLRDAMLVGHSMGTGEVTRYLGSYGSGRVAKAVLISPIPPFLLQAGDNPEGLPGSLFDGFVQAAKADSPAFLKGFLDNFYNIDVLGGTLVSDQAFQASLDIATAASATAAVACIPTWETDFRADLPKINVPTLVLDGDADRILPYDQTGKRLPGMIKDMELITIEGGPHAIAWTHTDQVNRALLSFIG